MKKIGRPLTAGEFRKARTLRATGEEWELHLKFDKIIKYGNKKAAQKFIEKYEIEKTPRE